MRDLLDSDDTRVMLDALRALGVARRARARHAATVACTGAAARSRCRRRDLFLGNAGTAFRPLTAVLALRGGDYALRGVPRMHERPIGDLVDALRRLGADIDYTRHDGLSAAARSRRRRCAPARTSRARRRIEPVPDRAADGAAADGGGSRASRSIGELISKPYVEITLEPDGALRRRVERDGWRVVHRARGRALPSPGRDHVEGDASSASYFLAAGGDRRRAGAGRGRRPRQHPGRRALRRRARAAWARASLSGDDWIEVRAGPPLNGRSTATSTTFPTRR